MFSVSHINFANGVYGPGNQVNGLEVYIMDSSAKADKVISDFEKKLTPGMDPNVLVDQIMRDNHISDRDFTDSDVNRINRRIEAIYKSVNRGGWSF